MACGFQGSVMEGNTAPGLGLRVACCLGSWLSYCQGPQEALRFM